MSDLPNPNINNQQHEQQKQLQIEKAEDRRYIKFTIWSSCTYGHHWKFKNKLNKKDDK